MRTDHYPLVGSPDELERMAHCEQVLVKEARQALADERLVFALTPDMKWRRVSSIRAQRLSPQSPYSFRIAFTGSPYVRTFNKRGILLIEPKTEVSAP